MRAMPTGALRSTFMVLFSASTRMRSARSARRISHQASVPVNSTYSQPFHIWYCSKCSLSTAMSASHVSPTSTHSVPMTRYKARPIHGRQIGARLFSAIDTSI